MRDEENNGKPMTAEDYFNLGNKKTKIKDFDGAIDDFTKAIELDAENPIPYYNRGLAKSSKKNYDGAIADFTTAICFMEKAIKGTCSILMNKKEWQRWYVYHDRGLTKYKKQDYNGAIADYTKAIELKHNYLRAYHNRGIARDSIKQHEEALADFKKAFELTNYPIPTDKIFYRFRPINQYTLETLITDTFFVANPQNFNDPFDALLLRRDEDETPKSLYKFDQNIRIACVAAQDKNNQCALENILMWSYYAQDHKGIAIGYQFNQGKFKIEKAFLKNANYRKNFISNKFETIFEETYLTKSDKWQHEQEWRLVYHKDDAEQDPILLNLEEWGISVAEIVFGVHCPKTQRETIVKIFKNKPHKPQFYEMTLTADNLFGILKIPYIKK